MARQKLSEFRAKTLLHDLGDAGYAGVLLEQTADWKAAVAGLNSDTRYVAKVDEGVKGRFKQGLVRLDLSRGEVAPTVRELFAKGFSYVLVEPQVEHKPADERYLAVERTRAGLRVLTNRHGGVEVNAAAATLVERLYSEETAAGIAADLGLSTDQLARLITVFDDNYFGFLEINPLVVLPDAAGRPQAHLLDAAVEVDGEAASVVAGRWSVADLRSRHTTTPEEAAVLDLASRSQSSFRLEVLNPNGQVFLLLSGGGASVTLADEVHNQGFGKELANYGEYSGNPTPDETYVYTRQIISLLLKSTAKPKVLVIAGGVANFTDIRLTFDGVIRALQADEAKLVKQGIRVYVRRGGPHEAEGLARMEAYLREAGLLGAVTGPELILADIIPMALKHLTAGHAS